MTHCAVENPHPIKESNHKSLNQLNSSLEPRVFGFFLMGVCVKTVAVVTTDLSDL